MMESGKRGKEWYDGSLKEFLVANPSLRKTTYQGRMSTTKVKQGKRHTVQAYIMKSKAVQDTRHSKFLKYLNATHHNT